MTTEPLSSHEVFQFLRPDQVETISDNAEEVSFKAGQFVYRQGDKADHAFAVLKGQVALRLPRKDGVSLLIEEVTKGALFGSCICFQLSEYSVTAQCTEDSNLLSINAGTLKALMDEDLTMGYAVQTLISRTYFMRYLETMKKLQAIVQAMPFDAT
ncbi:MAG: cyclic nucleotide-binding domain-containing protein [bacterium]|nr:cyclic nucleotide-binding domain-containing protein [bacterium]